MSCLTAGASRTMHCDVHWQARMPLVGQSISSGPEIGVLLHARAPGPLPTLQHPSPSIHLPEGRQLSRIYPSHTSGLSSENVANAVRSPADPARVNRMLATKKDQRLPDVCVPCASRASPAACYRDSNVSVGRNCRMRNATRELISSSPRWSIIDLLFSRQNWPLRGSSFESPLQHTILAHPSAVRCVRKGE